MIKTTQSPASWPGTGSLAHDIKVVRLVLAEYEHSGLQLAPTAVSSLTAALCRFESRAQELENAAGALPVPARATDRLAETVLAEAARPGGNVLLMTRPRPFSDGGSAA